MRNYFGSAYRIFGGPRLPQEVVSARQNFSARRPVRLPFRLKKLRVPCLILQVRVPKFKSAVPKILVVQTGTKGRGQTRMKVNKSRTLARVLSPTYVDFMHSHQPNRCTSREKSHADFRLPTLINSHSRLTAASNCLPSHDPVNKRSSSALKSNSSTKRSTCNTKSCS